MKIIVQLTEDSGNYMEGPRD